jgi:hypothetical protein
MHECFTGLSLQQQLAYLAVARFCLLQAAAPDVARLARRAGGACSISISSRLLLVSSAST